MESYILLDCRVLCIFLEGILSKFIAIACKIFKLMKLSIDTVINGDSSTVFNTRNYIILTNLVLMQMEPI